MINEIEYIITILSNQMLNILDEIDETSDYTKIDKTQGIRHNIYDVVSAIQNLSNASAVHSDKLKALIRDINSWEQYK